MKNKPIGGFLMNTFKRSISKILFVCLFIGHVQTAQAGWRDYVQSATSWAKSAISSVSSYFTGQTEQVVEVVRQNKETTIAVGIFGGIGVAVAAFALWKRYKQSPAPAGNPPAAPIKVVLPDKQNDVGLLYLVQKKSGDGQNSDTDQSPKKSEDQGEQKEEQEKKEILHEIEEKIKAIESDLALLSEYDISKFTKKLVSINEIKNDMQKNVSKRIDANFETLSRDIKKLEEDVDQFGNKYDTGKGTSWRTQFKFNNTQSDDVGTGSGSSDSDSDDSDDSEIPLKINRNPKPKRHNSQNDSDGQNSVDQPSQKVMGKGKEKEEPKQKSNSNQNQSQEKFSPEGDLLFTSKQIQDAAQAEEELKDNSDSVEDSDDWTEPVIWPNESLFDGLDKVTIINQDKIEKHINDLYESYKGTLYQKCIGLYKRLFYKQDDDDSQVKKQFKDEAEFLIKFGGRCFYALCSGQKNTLPHIIPRPEIQPDHLDLQRRAQLQVITAIQWFLYSQALSYGEEFWQGTFVLDAEKSVQAKKGIDALYEYMLDYVKKVNKDGCDKVAHGTFNYYALCRASTHFKEYKDKNKHYGIDIDWFTLDNKLFMESDSLKSSIVQFLPTGQIHLLFGKLDDRIFCKPEDHGLCGYKLRGLIQHGGGVVCSLVRKAVGSNEKKFMRKEHIPESVIAKSSQVFTEAPKPKTIAELWKKITQEYDTEQEDDSKEEKIRDLKEFLLAHWRHVDKRFGNEVYLTSDDLLPASYCYTKANKQDKLANLITLTSSGVRAFYAMRKGYYSDNQWEQEYLGGRAWDRLRGTSEQLNAKFSIKKIVTLAKNIEVGRSLIKKQKLFNLMQKVPLFQLFRIEKQQKPIVKQRGLVKAPSNTQKQLVIYGKQLTWSDVQLH